uniref:Uncharacterized protein n=1 Tax=Anguilla anguilla TaxID=7936 RepID=A0A0E9SM91_ANGAN
MPFGLWAHIYNVNTFPCTATIPITGVVQRQVYGSQSVWREISPGGSV